MKRLPSVTLGSALLSLLLITAAWTNEPSQPRRTTNGTLVPAFVSTRWQMASFTLEQPVDYDGDGQPDTDLTRFLRPCDLDNTISFEPNGELATDPGKLRCNDTASVTPKPGTWTYDDATQKLRIVGSNGSITQWTVVEASAKHLTLAQDDQSMKAIITWKRA